MPDQVWFGVEGFKKLRDRIKTNESLKRKIPEKWVISVITFGGGEIRIQTKKDNAKIGKSMLGVTKKDKVPNRIFKHCTKVVGIIKCIMV